MAEENGPSNLRRRPPTQHPPSDLEHSTSLETQVDPSVGQIPDGLAWVPHALPYCRAPDRR